MTMRPSSSSSSPPPPSSPASVERASHLSPKLHFRSQHLPPLLDSDHTHWYGYALLALTHALFVVSMYAIWLSKVSPATGNEILDSIRDDRYYSLLVPLTLLVVVYFVFLNWMGMKFFRHN